MNDLSYTIKHSSLFKNADDPNKIEVAINNGLASINKWYDENGMRRNPEKYQAMVIGKKREKPIFCCENTYHIIPIQNEKELFGIAVDDELKFEAHVSKICRKVSQKIAVLKRMKKIRLTPGKIYTRHLYYSNLNIVQILGISVVNTLPLN